MATTKSTTPKFVTNFAAKLARDNKSFREDRANRIGKVVLNGQQQLVNKLENEMMMLENELEGMLDMSSDNRSTTVNRVKDLDPNDFLKEYQEKSVAIELKKVELKIAKQNLENLFS